MKKMMVSLSFMALFAMAIATETYVTEDDVEYIVVALIPEHCEPGKKYKVTSNCSKCTCLAEKDLECTRQICGPHAALHEIPWGPFSNNGDPCPANEEFYNECNLCRCGPDGKRAVCTRETCIRPAI